MVDPVKLGAAEKASLIERSRIAAVRNQAAKRLATGLRVSEVRDGPGDFYQAKALTDRVARLRETKADIGQGIDALRTAQAGTQAVEDLSKQLKGIALATRDADATEKARLAEQFDLVRGQIDSLVGDASYQGVNLIDGAGSLRVDFSANSGDRLDVAASANDAASLGVGNAASFNDFASLADVDNAISAIDGAIDTVRANQSRIVGNAGVLGARGAFAENLAATALEGADKIVLADLHEEAARHLAATVRDDLALSTQRIAGRSAQRVLELVKGG